jgi:hypothetical protein
MQPVMRHVFDKVGLSEMVIDTDKPAKVILTDIEGTLTIADLDTRPLHALMKAFGKQ